MKANKWIYIVLIIYTVMYVPNYYFYYPGAYFYTEELILYERDPFFCEATLFLDPGLEFEDVDDEELI